MTTIEKITQVQQRIKQACENAHRDPEDVTLLAISKKKPTSMIREAWNNGLHHFGENYIQEWRAKNEELEDLKMEGLHWHITGPLQKNKCKYVAGKVALIHTISSLSLLEEIAKRTPKEIIQPVLIQCNLSKEATKSGFQEIEQIEQLLTSHHHWKNIDIQGFMVLPPFSENPEDSRSHFHQLQMLREKLRSTTGLPLPHLSMGMSADLEIAIEEGATIVRVGTAIFGQRVS